MTWTDGRDARCRMWLVREMTLTSKSTLHLAVLQLRAPGPLNYCCESTIPW